MPSRKIIALSDNEAWKRFLIEAFDDTSSIPEIKGSREEVLSVVRQGSPDLVFVQKTSLTKPLIAAFQTQRVSHPHFRVFCIGSAPSSAGAIIFHFDGEFGDVPPPLFDFQKKLGAQLPLPDPLRILVADDDPTVGETIRDYFDQRTGPAFVVDVAKDGLEAEQRIDETKPNVLILDLRMPEKDGQELYRDLHSKGIHIPTVIFTDLISPDQVIGIRRWGNPAIVEKGSQAASMSALAGLVRKLAYFG